MMRISQQRTGAIQYNRMAHNGLRLQEQSWRSCHLPPKCLGIVGELAHHRLHVAVKLGGCKPGDTEAKLSIDTNVQGRRTTTWKELSFHSIRPKGTLGTHTLAPFDLLARTLAELAAKDRTCEATDVLQVSKRVNMLHSTSCKLTQESLIAQTSAHRAC